MARSIKSIADTHTDYDFDMTSPSRGRKVVPPDVQERELMLGKKAKGFSIRVTITGGVYRFRKIHNSEVVASVNGLWAAEQFLRGIEFVYTIRQKEEKLGLWKGDEWES